MMPNGNYGKQRKRNKLSIAMVVLLAIVLIVFVFLFLDADPNVDKTVNSAPKEVKLSVLCVGDIMLHVPQLNAQYDMRKKQYNFDNNYKYVKPYIESADLALCNLETTFAGKPYTGFPTFSAPDSLAAALKKAGFDVSITANNHMADKGIYGIKRTQNVLKKNKLKYVGSVLEKRAPRYIIQDVKGVKVGIVAYTYETGPGTGSTAINGSVITNEEADLINSFNFNTLDDDVNKIKQSIDNAKSNGAEIIIAYYHWGEEFQKSANRHQMELAQRTADIGADVIFASHPHVLQEMDYIKNKKTGKKVPVFYSMGNFISNQREETMANRYTEEGLLAQVNLVYSKEKNEIKKIAMSGVPTWLDKYDAGGKAVFEIIPLDKNMKDNKALAVSGHVYRAKQALEDSNEILGLDQ